MANKYKPNIDLAFKNRITTKFNSYVTKQITDTVTKLIPDDLLTNGMQRIVLSDAIASKLKVDINKSVAVIVVDRYGKPVMLETHDKYTLIGVIDGTYYCGIVLSGADYGYNGIRVGGIYDAVITAEKRDILEVNEPTQREVTYPQKNKKRK